ncbi:hypothetical protein TI04_00590 [Achromatium sp. WMS2]|nr:hypothetical protein TI04_00590 [Achromatium sp. WMS2]
MSWERILWAVAIGAMILLVFPYFKTAISNSRPAEPGEWASALLPIAVVVGFVMLLVSFVR